MGRVLQKSVRFEPEGKTVLIVDDDPIYREVLDT